jgi:hypothetical protein
MGKRPFTKDERNYFVQKVIEGLEKGIPLAVTCREVGVSTDAIYDWESEDESIKRRIARARDMGHDHLAQEALEIADDSKHDTISTEHGEKMDAEWVARSKLRVETRLKLLAKWNPRKYGDRIDVTSGGEKLEASDGLSLQQAAKLAAILAEAEKRKESDDD